MSDTIKLNLKFCSRFLLKGKKTKAEKILKRLLNSLSSKRYHPHKTLYLALLNLRPLIELRQIKKRRKKFLVPFPLKKNRRLFLALNFFFNFSLSDKRSRTEEIVKKIIIISEGSGNSMINIKEMHKEARKSRIHLHFRWL